MGIFDKARKAASEHGDELDEAVDKLARAVDEKTGGRHADKVGKGASAAKGLIDRLSGGEGPRREGGEGEGPGSDRAPRG